MRNLRVLVTGGSGCFGMAFTRYALDAGVARIIVYSRDEEKHRRMREAIPDGRLDFFGGDVRDYSRLRRAMQAWHLDGVIHAAAAKQVPWCEANPGEAVQTNIIGTANVIEAALDAGLPRVLAISTDKAVQPLNLYGATKAVMERLMVAANVYRGKHGTRFGCVRYGNVVSSTGSVLEMWRAQVAAGQPLTVTDPDMTRFWWTVQEAAAFTAWAFLVLVDTSGGEVFVPKLRACRIGDLADAVAATAGARYPQTLIGLRPGEKAHEMLIAPDEPCYDGGWAWIIHPTQQPFGRAYTSDTVPRMTPQEVMG